MAEITHAKALRAIAATREFHEIASKFAPPAPRRRPTVKPKHTLALARKMAKANGYNTVGIEQLDSGRWSVWMYALGTPELKPARCTAPTRTAAIAGLIAVIDALPKGGKR